MRHPLPLLRPAVPALARIEPSSALGSSRDDRVTTLVVTSAIVASAGLVAMSRTVIETVSEQPGRVATLLALTLVLQLFSVRVYGRGSVSVSAIGMLASVFLLDTGTAMAVAVAAALAQWLRRRGQLHKAIFDGANFAISAATASIVFHAANGWRPGAAVLAGCVFAALNNGLLCLAMSLSEGSSWRTIWLERFHWARFHFALFGPVALAAAIAYQKTGIAGLAAFALPPALMMRAVRQY